MLELLLTMQPGLTPVTCPIAVEETAATELRGVVIDGETGAELLARVDLMWARHPETGARSLTASMLSIDALAYPGEGVLLIDGYQPLPLTWTERSARWDSPRAGEQCGVERPLLVPQSLSSSR